MKQLASVIAAVVLLLSPILSAAEKQVTLFVSEEDPANSLAQITVKGQNVVSTTQLNCFPRPLVAPDQNTLYLACATLPGGSGPHQLLIMDISKKKMQLAGTIDISSTPWSMVMDSTGSYLYIATSAGIDVVDIRLDPATKGSRANTFLGTTPQCWVGGLSIHGTTLVADSPGGSFCGLPGGVVFSYDISGIMPVLTNQTAPFQGVAAQMLIHSPDATKVYLGLDGATWVTDENGQSVYANFIVLDASTLAVRSTQLVATDGQVASLEGAVTVRSRLYTAGINGIAYVFDTTADQLLNSIPLSPGSYFVGLAATDTRVYLTNYMEGKIYSIILGDLASGDQIGPTIDLGIATHPSRIVVVTK